MSTRIAVRRGATRAPASALFALLLAGLAAGCGRSHTTSVPSGICRGSNVVQEIDLQVDSVGPMASEELRPLQGSSHRITVTLLNPVPTGGCTQRFGAGQYIGELPGALRTATAHDRVLAWRVEGTMVGLNLNHLVMDNNIAIMMPLNGRDGTWSLNTMAGPVVTGRALVRRE